MKKKLIPLITAFACAIACALSLSACGENEKPATIDCLYITDGVNNDYAGQQNYYVSADYGETLDFSKYKLFLHYTNTTTEEVSRTDAKITVKYYTEKQTETQPVREEITDLPQKMTVGTYVIEYTYDGKAEHKAEVNISIMQSTDGRFRLQTPHRTLFMYQKFPAPEVFNSDSQKVTAQTNEEYTGNAPLPKDDTKARYIYYYAIEKTAYDGFTDEQKKDYEFIGGFTVEANADKWYYCAPDNEIAMPEGSYMLLACFDGTFNYKETVTNAIPITVKHHFIERKFTLQNMVLVDGDGNELTDEDNSDYGEYIAMTKSFNESNAKKTVICKPGHIVRGTVDFGGGTFDELADQDEAYQWLIDHTSLSIWTADSSVSDSGASDLSIGDGSLDGNTLTFTMYIYDTPYKWVITFTAPLLVME